MVTKFGQNYQNVTSIKFRLILRLLMTSSMRDQMTLVKSYRYFKNDWVQLGSLEETLTKTKFIWTTLNNADHVIVIRIHDLEKHASMSTRTHITKLG